MQAAAYYAQAKNSDALADALYQLEDFDSLEQLIAATPEGSPLLLQLGSQFHSVGLCQQASTAYIKVRLFAAMLGMIAVTETEQAQRASQALQALHVLLPACTVHSFSICSGQRTDCIDHCDLSNSLLSSTGVEQALHSDIRLF